MTAQENDKAAWLKGPLADCSTIPVARGRSWRLVLLGAPGIGKGTQAELLNQRLRACHLSTGDVFRAALKSEGEPSAAMTDALGYMKRGDLVPDEVVINMVAERERCMQCAGGFLLDGYPRTVDQARALDELLRKKNVALDAVLSFELPMEKVIARLGGRRVCSKCRKTYHITHNPPATEGICDACGGDLFQREDDRPEAIAVRMKAYEESTAPLIEYYEKQNLLLRIPAEGSPEEICEAALKGLGAE